jgi:exopolyphosphatase/guanosine-5'-triphosphate,3'-diphosphate pyrophosphatase
VTSAAVAAVDVGANSVRLLVAEPGGEGHLTQVVREMRITRLGQGIDATGHLDDAALGRTLEVIGEYAAIWQERGVERVRIAATSAVRDADDRGRFFDGVRERTGVDAVVLSGEQEAATAFLGATAAVRGDAPYLVLDIGGGSTELILGEGGPVASSSRQLGCVRLTERALRSDPPTRAELDAAAAIAAAELDAAAMQIHAEQARTLVGVAGSVTTLGALHLGLDAYEPERIHGTRVPRQAVAALTVQLGAMTTAERAALGPMAPGREDVIVGGAIILACAMARFGFAEVLVSEADILDGLALELLRAAGPAPGQVD